jgi:predicted HNH restriction endonuclease
VDLHHLDGNHDNNSKKNLIGLCPNHHKMIHMIEFKEEILKQLKQKGFETGSL